MSYITVRLMGGLGNQLFQIATAVAQAAEHGVDFFLMDGHFDGATTGSHPSKYYSTLYSKIPRKPLPEGIRALPYNERDFAYKDFGSYTASCKKNGMGLILKGYFQSERYFAKYAAIIKSLFTPPEGLDTYIRTKTNLYSAYPELKPPVFAKDCSNPELDPTAPSDDLTMSNPGSFKKSDGKKRAFIGVRRGDYCKDAHNISVHNPASMDYYRKAMAAVKADVYYVMSDDIAWCKKQFISGDALGTNAEFIFFEEPDDLRSFFFARLFDTYICANSTFHWWASYLSIYPNPIVYTPKEHFGPAGPQDYQDYFRADMIRVSNEPPNRIVVSSWFQKDYPFINVPNNSALIIDRPYYILKDISNIYFQVEPKIIMDVDTFLIENHKYYSHIYTYSEDVLKACPNAKKYVFGTTRIRKTTYNNIDIGRKQFRISNITGTKKINNAPGHILRHLIHYNQKALGEKFPITFYRSSQPPYIEDLGDNKILDPDIKDELFLDYQYSFVIENSRQTHYFTEKLVDCLLTKTIPIYYGAPNIDSYFNTTGWIILEHGTLEEINEKMSILNDSYYAHYRDVIEENWKRALGFSVLEVNIDNAV